MYIGIYVLYIYIYMDKYIFVQNLRMTDLGDIKQKLTSMYMCHVLGDV